MRFPTFHCLCAMDVGILNAHLHSQVVTEKQELWAAGQWQMRLWAPRRGIFCFLDAVQTLDSDKGTHLSLSLYFGKGPRMTNLKGEGPRA